MHILDDILSGKYVYRRLISKVKNKQYTYSAFGPIDYNVVMKFIGKAKLVFCEHEATMIAEAWENDHVLLIMTYFHTPDEKERVVSSIRIYSDSPINHKFKRYFSDKYIVYHVYSFANGRQHYVRSSERVKDVFLPDKLKNSIATTADLINNRNYGLLVWYGPKGSGKTYSVSYLLSLLDKDVEVIYLLEPELIFPSSTGIASIIGDFPSSHILIVCDVHSRITPQCHKVIEMLLYDKKPTILALTRLIDYVATWDVFPILQTVEFSQWSYDDAMKFIKRSGKDVKLQRKSYTPLELMGIVNNWQTINLPQPGFINS